MRGLFGTLGIVALGLAIWFLLSSPDGTSGDGGAPTAAREEEQVAASERSASATGGESSSALESRPFEATPSADEDAPGDSVVISGRCVAAEDGEPLAGVTVDLHGWGANRERIEAYRSEHGEVTWQDPEDVVTEADGRFTFRFVPPPPYQFSLRFEVPERVRALGQWPELSPGERMELGDVALARAATLRGVVVDTRDVPQADVRVVGSVVTSQELPGPISLFTQASTKTRGDGTFELRSRLPLGTCRLRVRDRQLVDDEHVYVDLEAPDRVAEARLVVRPPEEIARISGEVVDQHDRPLKSGTVSCQGLGSTRVSRGRFAFERRPHSPEGPFTLHVQAEGCVPLESEDPVSWGDEELRLVVQLGPRLELFVHRAETGEPVEDYGIVMVPIEQTTSTAWPRQGVVERGRHPGGRLELAPRPPGSYLVRAVPEDDVLAPSLFRRVDLRAGGPTVSLPVHAARPRTIRVVDQDGVSVEGTRLDLIVSRGDEACALDTRAAASDRLHQMFGFPAIQLGEGITDVNGECHLIVSPEQKPCLRVLGPGHIPVLVRDVSWPAEGTALVVRVSRGATIMGRLEPPEILEQLKGPRHLSESSVSATNRPGLRLERNEGTPRHLPGRRTAFEIDGQGRFRIEGVPSGNWNMKLRLVNEVKRGLGVNVSSEEFLVEQCHALEHGETREVVIDCSHLLRSTIQGRVMVDGAPPPEAYVSLHGLVSSAGAKVEECDRQNIPLDEEGRFDVSVVPGRYRAVLQVVGKGRNTFLSAPEIVEVAPGETVAEEWSLRSTSLCLVVRAADGEMPIEGARLRLRHEDPNGITPRQKTDAQGQVRFEGCHGARVEVQVFPKALLDREEFKAWRERTGRSREEAWLPVTVLTLVGSEQERIISLPTAAGY